MKYLIDTNVFLEAFLRRTHWEESATFFAKVKPADVAVADFSLHSMGFYLCRRTPESFEAIVNDVVSRNAAVLRLMPSQLLLVTRNIALHRLDFDDAFVYTVAEIHDLQIVSFDTDFDRTPRGRKTPGAVLES